MNRLPKTIAVPVTLLRGRGRGCSCRGLLAWGRHCSWRCSRMNVFPLPSCTAGRSVLEWSMGITGPVWPLEGGGSCTVPCRGRMRVRGQRWRPRTALPCQVACSVAAPVTTIRVGRVREVLLRVCRGRHASVTATCEQFPQTTPRCANLLRFLRRRASIR